MSFSQTSTVESSSGLSLARRLAEGSSAAWCDLIELYGPLVDRWCRAARIPPSAIADIAQETFLATFRSIHRFDPAREGATFRGWLWTVARSRMQNYYRRNQHFDLAAGGSTANARLHELAEALPLEEPSQSSDLIRLLQRAMARVQNEFEPRTWQMFQDAVIGGEDSAVIAARYSVSTAAARQAKSRVLRRLRLELGDA